MNTPWSVTVGHGHWCSVAPRRPLPRSVTLLYYNRSTATLVNCGDHTAMRACENKQEDCLRRPRRATDIGGHHTSPRRTP